MLEIREKVRLYLDLTAAKEAWQKRIHATFFHQGVRRAEGRLLAGRQVPAGLADPDLSPAGVQAVDVALRMIAAIDAELTPLRAELVAFGRRHPGPRELAHEYGLGDLLATVVWEELGDPRRLRDDRHVAPTRTRGTTTGTSRTHVAQDCSYCALRVCRIGAL